MENQHIKSGNLLIRIKITFFTVCDEVVAKQLAEQLPEIDVETDISFTQLESWAVRKDSPVLLDSLNSWLQRFRNSPEFKKMYGRYY